MKKVLSFMLVFVLLFSVVGCSNTEPAEEQAEENASEEVTVKEASANEGDTLVVWTFTDELKGIIENYYVANNDLDYEVDVVVVPNENYQAKLDPALGSGKSAPDVFAVEAGYAKKYVDSEFTKDLTEIGINPDEIDTMEYVMEVATSPEGELKGLSWQATPGAYFYRRSLAQEYLGVSEPAEVQALISDFDKFYETGKEIKEKSNGETKIVSSLGDFTRVFLSAREDAWVEEGKFIIDPKVEELMEIGKKFNEDELTLDAQQWTETWFSGMSSDSTFGYFLPTWGLHFVLKPNSENADTGETTFGDWGMVQGPSPYFWGGTWLTVREGTEMESAAYDLIHYLTMNEEFLTQYAKDSGDLLSNTAVVNEIKDDFSEPFLDGQNHYALFAEMAKNIDASTMTGSDLDIEDLFEEQLVAYTKGEKSKEEALEDFRSNVKNSFPNLEQ
ncbi:MAG TPA: ABC transporter substrate-binding protein [Clostridia bacterium]|nr:ABC transporter substrate-binding protein [Clostridia bacterium]